MKPPFFLFPGLSCNERLFETQKFGLDNRLDVIIPDWIRPTGSDGIETFSLRWAEFIWENYYSESARPENRLDPALGCWVGGHSFGGIVAFFVGKYLEEKGVKVHTCFRFASPDEPTNISAKWLYLGRFMNLFPDGAWLTIKSFCFLWLCLFSGRDLLRAREKMYRQVVESPVRRNFHLVRMLYSWRDQIDWRADFQVIVVRGTEDSVIPFDKSLLNTNVVVLPHAGHGMMVTHGGKINDLIRKFI